MVEVLAQVKQGIVVKHGKTRVAYNPHLQAQG